MAGFLPKLGFQQFSIHKKSLTQLGSCRVMNQEVNWLPPVIFFHKILCPDEFLGSRQRFSAAPSCPPQSHQWSPSHRSCQATIAKESVQKPCKGSAPRSNSASGTCSATLTPQLDPSVSTFTATVWGWCIEYSPCLRVPTVWEWRRYVGK